MAIAKRGTTSAPAGGRTASQEAPGTEGGGYASLNPDDFIQGGLLDDVDVLFKTCRFVEYDYDGKADKPALCLLVSMEHVEDGKTIESEQYYSAGSLDRFQPSEDGSHAVSVAGAKGLALGTNIAALLKSLKDTGFPMDKFGDGDMSVLDGLFAHINRVPQQVRKGLAQSDTNDKGFQRTVAIVTKIHRMPWEKPGSKTSGKATPINKGKTAGQAAKAPVEEDVAEDNETGEAADVSETAAGVLLAVLADKNGSVKKVGLAPASFKHLKDYPDERSEILKMFANSKWLEENGENFGWTFDGTTVTAA